MFDNFLVRSDSLKNDRDGDEVTGFRFAVRIADYRGCFLSLHNGYYIDCDGVEYGRDKQTFEINGKAPRSFEELKKCIWEHWDFDDEAIVHVRKPGGLKPGEHVLRIQQSVLMQYGYAPWDEEWVKNPPTPGSGIGSGKSSVKFEYSLKLEDE